jgi:hypothetical protein
MTWLLEPGSIEHIQHMWQPTKGWGNALLHLDVALNDFECLVSHKVNYNTLYIEQFVWSVKIDDRISLRVSKIGGKYGVSYKTLSNPWLMSDEEIDASYYDQPYIAYPLKNLLSLAPKMFKAYEDDIGYQVGVLTVSDEPIYDTVKPNVTTYTFPTVKPYAKIVLTPVVKFRYKDGKPTFMTQEIDWTWFQSIPEIVTIDPRPELPEAPHRTKFDLLKAARENFNNFRAESYVLEALEDYYPHIRMYLNKLVREGLPLADGDNEAEAFVEWYDDLHEKSAAELKTQKGYDARIAKLKEDLDFLEEHRGHLERLFDTVNWLKPVRNAVLDIAIDHSLKNGVRQSPAAEGLVVTRNVGNSLMAFKFVPESFSKANFDKHR